MQRNALSWCNRTLNRQVVNKTAGLDQETLLLDAMFEIPGSDMVTAARDSSTSTPVLQPGSSSTPVLQPGSSSTPVLQPGSSSTPVLQPSSSSTPVLQPGSSSTPVLQPDASSDPVLQPDILHGIHPDQVLMIEFNATAKCIKPYSPNLLY
ncbi:uncharacterized protein LOC143035097 isoform X2 [Oratosquilla oratoria]|uniref:uncharacterized protein LOC143035097 isoform X2 n=1 Tax=Oratosquilla oratoria TaxID=337810 RepID=UPI003F76D36A